MQSKHVAKPFSTCLFVSAEVIFATAQVFFEGYLTFDREAGSTDQSKAWTDECTNGARVLDPLASRNRQGVGCFAPTLPELA